MTKSGTRHAQAGLWILTCAVAFVVSGCGDSDTGPVAPTEEQAQAQNNMENFMKNQKSQKSKKK